MVVKQMEILSALEYCTTVASARLPHQQIGFGEE
jgi:hypothetical protein